MEKSNRGKRVTAWMLVIALVMTAVFHPDINVRAASAKHIKSVTLKVGSRKVNRKTYKLEEGRKITLKVSASPAKAKKKVEFKSQKTVIATVSRKGRVTAKSTGTSKITVTVTGKDGKKVRAWVKLKVTKAAKPSAVQEITTQAGTTQQDPSARPGESTRQGTTERSGGNAQQGTTERSSGNAQQGTTERPGGNTQQATDKPSEGDTQHSDEEAHAGTTERQTATESSSEAPGQDGIEIRADQKELYVGMSEKLTAVFTAEGSDDAITWESGDPGIAMVDGKGIVTGRKAGKVIITAATGDGRKGSVILTVKKIAVTGVRLEQEGKLELNAGASAPLKAVVTPANATDRTVRWSSSDEEVARVDAEGYVTAGHLDGSAVITVTTNDGELTASCTVVVTEVSEDVGDGIRAGVTNSLKGYDGMVLVGTDAELTFHVFRNGAVMKNQSVHIALEPVSGYTGYYELDNNEVDTGADGTGTVSVRLKEKYRQSFGAFLYQDTDETKLQPAYASFRLTFSAGKIKDTETVPVSFGQVVPATQYGLKHGHTAMTVDNQYDLNLKQLEAPDNCGYSIGNSENESGYLTQYVAGQQVGSKSDPSADHKVYLDAAPLLCCAAGGEEESADLFERKIGKGQSDYTVYQDEYAQDAVLVEKVPGNLQYLNLTFSAFQLSRYTRLVVRAYQPGKMEPVVYNRENGEQVLAEKIFDSTYLVENGENLYVGQEIFAATRMMDQVDLRIFVESAGQVDAGSHGGFSLTKLKGKYADENRKAYVYRRMDSAVTWEFGTVHGRQGSRLLEADQARQLVAGYYFGDHNYYVSLPNYPETGNAIIKEYDRKKNLVGYYLYPTMVQDGQNALLTDGEGLVPAYLSKVTKNAAQMLEEKDYSWKADEASGRAVIESYKEGYVPVKASVQIGETGNEITYSVYSYIQWLPIPEKTTERINDFYALAGQRLRVTAVFTDPDGAVPEVSDVNWKYYDKESSMSVSLRDVISKLGVTVHWMDEQTDRDGIAVLELSSDGALDLERITAAVTGCRVSYAVRHKAVMTDGLRLHWILPGILYRNEAGGIEVNTTDDGDILEEAQNLLLRTPGEYDTTEKWILGARIVGKTGDPSAVVKSVQGLKLAAAAEGESDVTVTELSQGVWSLSGRGKGLSTLTVSFMEPDTGTEEEPDQEKTAEELISEEGKTSEAGKASEAGKTSEEEKTSEDGKVSEDGKTSEDGEKEDDTSENTAEISTEKPAGTGGTTEKITEGTTETATSETAFSEATVSEATTSETAEALEGTTEKMTEGAAEAAETGEKETEQKEEKQVCLFEIERDGKLETHENMGEGDYVTSRIEIPMRWSVSGANLKLINHNPKFDMNNVKLNQDAVPHVYAQVLGDDLVSAVEDVDLTVNISSSEKGKIVTDNVRVDRKSSAGELIEAEGVKTDANGLYDIDLSKYVDIRSLTEEDTIAVSVYITADGKGQSQGTTVAFVKNDSYFTLIPETEESKPVEITVDPDTKEGNVILSFNGRVNASGIPEGELRRFFRVKDETGEELEAFDASLLKTDAAKVVLTVPDCQSEQLTVQIEPVMVQDGLVYYFMNRDGILYSDTQKDSKKTGSR